MTQIKTAWAVSQAVSWNSKVYSTGKKGEYNLKFYKTLYLYKGLFQNVEYTKVRKNRDEIFLYNFKGDKIKQICEKIDFNSYKNYLSDSGIDCFDERTKRYYNKGVLPKYKGCHVDSLGDLYDKDGNPVSWEKGVYVLPLIPALLISGLVATIVICIMVAKNKMVKKAVDAKDYLDEDSIKYTAKNDTFVSTHTSSYRISSSSGGGHGGGSHHSSGGFSHGGGGRHC